MEALFRNDDSEATPRLLCINPDQGRKSESNREDRLRDLLCGCARKAAVRSEWAQCFLNPYVPDIAQKLTCLSGGRCPSSLVHSVTPISCHGSIQVAGALMAFKCLSCACNFNWPGPQLKGEWGKEERRALTLLGGSYWGIVDLGPLEHAREYPWQSSSIASTDTGLFTRV